jgi:hypothetical protein
MKTIALAVLLATTFAVAQEKPIVYRLEYTITEMDGAKKLSSRSYTLQVEDHHKGTMRVGTRVAVPSGSFATGTADSNIQYEYRDVGVNLDVTLSTIDSTSLRLETTVDINSLVTPDSSTSATSRRPPATRQCRDQVTTVIPLDKPVTLTTQDDPSYNTSMQVQVIARIVK